MLNASSWKTTSAAIIAAIAVVSPVIQHPEKIWDLLSSPEKMAVLVSAIGLFFAQDHNPQKGI